MRACAHTQLSLDKIILTSTLSHAHWYCLFFLKTVFKTPYLDPKTQQWKNTDHVNKTVIIKVRNTLHNSMQTVFKISRWKHWSNHISSVNPLIFNVSNALKRGNGSLPICTIKHEKFLYTLTLEELTTRQIFVHLNLCKQLSIYPLYLLCSRNLTPPWFLVLKN